MIIISHFSLPINDLESWKLRMMEIHCGLALSIYTRPTMAQVYGLVQFLLESMTHPTYQPPFQPAYHSAYQTPYQTPYQPAHQPTYFYL